VVSASHNPFGDNGLKLFARGGVKLSDTVQQQLETVLEAWTTSRPSALGPVPTGVAVGEITLGDPCPEYVTHLVGAIDGRSLDGFRVVLDCAHGAASTIGPEVFRRLGADVTVLNDQWDGQNINDGCGSTHPEALQRAVVERSADLGCAFDGDADRMLAVDRRGRVIDGDQLMAIAAIDLDSRGALVDRTVVVTVMSNLGFRLGMRAHGITVLDTKVGDRYVLEALESGGYALGGEQSGHLIFRDAATTGDGVLAGVRIADIVRRTGTGLGALADAAMRKLPQVLTNVRVTSPMGDVVERLAEDIAAAESDLGETGRVLVRPSGTEPLVRVMVEAVDSATAQRWADELSRAVEALM